MNDLEKHLESSRPDIQVPNFQRNLRRDLLYSVPEESPSPLGYMLAFCAGGILTVLVMMMMASFQPEKTQQFMTAFAPAPAAPVEASPATNALPGRTISRDELLQALANTESFSQEADHTFVNNWSRKRGRAPLQLQTVAEEQILRVREYRTNTGELVRVYTSLDESEEQTIY